MRFQMRIEGGKEGRGGRIESGGEGERETGVYSCWLLLSSVSSREREEVS